MRHLSQQLKDCIQLCLECSTTCQEILFTHCLPMGGKHAAPEHIALMTDCAKACATAADFMSRNSTFHGSECAICAEICDACAKSCERLDGPLMKRCAEICRMCAESCRNMSNLRSAA